MSRTETTTYTRHTGPIPPRPSNAAYYLATTQDLMHFYLFDEPKEDGSTPHEIIEHLDRSKLLAAGDKATAKEWAKRLKLKSWTYVRV